MDANYINSFIIGAEDIFSQMAPQVDIVREKPYLKEQSIKTDTVVSVIEFTGDISGKALYVFKDNFALELVGMMCGMPWTQLDEMAISALGEVSNMISGRAVIKLDELAGAKVNITPPAIVHNEQINVEPKTICIPYLVNNEKYFEINFCIE